jgi:hypothetical protein
MLLSSNNQAVSGHVALLDFGKLTFVAAPLGTIKPVPSQAVPVEGVAAISLTAVVTEGKEKWLATAQANPATQLITESLAVGVRELPLPADVSYFDASAGTFIKAENQAPAKTVVRDEFLVMMDSGSQNVRHELYDVVQADDKQTASKTPATHTHDTDTLVNRLKKLTARMKWKK